MAEQARNITLLYTKWHSRVNIYNVRVFPRESIHCPWGSTTTGNSIYVTKQTAIQITYVLSKREPARLAPEE